MEMVSHQEKCLPWWLQTASGGLSLDHRWLCLERGSVGISPCEVLGLHVQVPQGHTSMPEEEGVCWSVLWDPVAAPQTWITPA